MNFDAAMAQLERLDPIPATLPTAFPITIGGEPPSRPALALSTPGRQEHTSTVDAGNGGTLVNTSKARRWRLVRMPEDLAIRLERLAGDIQRAYAEGRVEVPSALCEAIPMWYAVQNALDEQEARRARSNRPRSGRPR